MNPNFPAEDFEFDAVSQVYVTRTLRVMKSNAGFYLGREGFSPKAPDSPLPYSRESIYWKTAEEAQYHLDALS